MDEQLVAFILTVLNTAFILTLAAVYAITRRKR